MKLLGITLAVLLLASGRVSFADDDCNDAKHAFGQPGVHGKDGQPNDPKLPVALKIVSPAADQVLDGPNVEVKFELSNYDLDKDGNHIHFILDNNPYEPHYDGKAPHVFKGVAEGDHVIRAFPSRPWHESFKNPEAFAWVRFAVKKHDGKNAIDPTKPLLTYSRPKGDYAGKVAEQILLDFWVSGCTLSKGGFRVKETLDGKETIREEWKPYCWDKLAKGKHTIVLDLIDKDGKPVTDNAYNHTERTFEVK